MKKNLQLQKIFLFFKYFCIQIFKKSDNEEFEIQIRV